METNRRVFTGKGDRLCCQFRFQHRDIPCRIDSNDLGVLSRSVGKNDFHTGGTRHDMRGRDQVMACAATAEIDPRAGRRTARRCAKARPVVSGPGGFDDDDGRVSAGKGFRAVIRVCDIARAGQSEAKRRYARPLAQ